MDERVFGQPKKSKKLNIFSEFWRKFIINLGFLLQYLSQTSEGLGCISLDKKTYQSKIPCKKLFIYWTGSTCLQYLIYVGLIETPHYLRMSKKKKFKLLLYNTLHIFNCVSFFSMPIFFFGKNQQWSTNLRRCINVNKT